jgi:hypothetical protein
MKQWYETLFENYATRYDDEPFTRGTVGECDFLEKDLSLSRRRRYELCYPEECYPVPAGKWEIHFHQSQRTLSTISFCGKEKGR